MFGSGRYYELSGVQAGIASEGSSGPFIGKLQDGWYFKKKWYRSTESLKVQTQAVLI
jgi:hypothetical protein